MNVTLPRHIPAHYARRAYFGLIKIAFGIIGQICAEYPAQFTRRVLEDILRGIRQRIDLKVNIAQILVELGKHELYRGLGGICVDRRQLCPDYIACRAELPAEHKSDKLAENTVL